MVEIKFSRLKKEFPGLADEILVDQELLLVFLNSPIRDKIIKFAKLTKNETKSVMEIVNYYARLKVEEEKNANPENQDEVRAVEISILKKIFISEVIEFKKLKIKEAFDVAKNILRVEYPNSVVLNMLETDRIATLAGLDTRKKFPSELLVFDTEKKKI